MTWTYVTTLGDGSPDGALLEAGPFTTEDAALYFSEHALGHTVHHLHAISYLVSDMRDVTGNETIRGYTVERYDDEQTDPEWFIHGGLKEKESND